MSNPTSDYRNPERREHYVYRVFDAEGRLLYVGCTMRPAKRAKEHRDDRKPWIADVVGKPRLAGPYNYETARAIERRALMTESPLHCETPYTRGAKQREDRWVEREACAALPADWTMKDYLKARKKARKRARQIDWMAQSRASIGVPA